MSPSSNDRLVELTERILADDAIEADCLAGLAHKLKYSVDTGGREYVSRKMNELKDEIKHKLENVCRLSIDPNIAEWTDEMVAGMKDLDVCDFMVVSRQVCELFREYFISNGISARRLKKLSGTVNNNPGEEAPVAGSSFSMEKIKTDLEKFLTGADIYYILECLRRGDPRLLTAFGLRLPEDQAAGFFAVMSDYFPKDTFFCRSDGEMRREIGRKRKTYARH